jgi:hypothetical protein
MVKWHPTTLWRPNVNDKEQNTKEASGSLMTKGTDIMVSSFDGQDDEAPAGVRTIDRKNQHPNAHHQIRTARATGPRTQIGKQRSSRNGIKHGIFSEATLLKGESRAQFELLRTQMWETLRPEGIVEELLVDKLASLSWRYRRLLSAERAEIQKNTEFLEWDDRNRKNEEAERIGRRQVVEHENGLISKIQNPEILDCCLELLRELREQIKASGLQYEEDTSILYRIYGEEQSLRETPQDTYEQWSDTAETSEEERAREGDATPEECKENVLETLDEEIKRLKLFQRKNAALESLRIKIEIVRQSVPEGPDLDRLLRYETSLERAFDRTLGQLERLQRLRLGQPVAPRLEVNISK